MNNNIFCSFIFGSPFNIFFFLSHVNFTFRLYQLIFIFMYSVYRVYVNTCILSLSLPALSAGAVEYADCTSVKG